MKLRVASRLTFIATLISAAAAAHLAPPVQEVETTEVADSMADRLGPMGEPVLSDGRSLAGFTRRFRILVVESFGPSHAVRIDETAAGARFSLALQAETGNGHDGPQVARRSWALMTDAAIARVSGPAAQTAAVEPNLDRRDILQVRAGRWRRLPQLRQVERS